MKYTSMGTGLLTAIIIALSALLIGIESSPAMGSVTVTVSGPGGMETRSLPDAGGAFDVNMPLNRNAVNMITVKAQDANGNTASRDLTVTQVSLDQIVVSKITSEPLSVEEVEQLVDVATGNKPPAQSYNELVENWNNEKK